MVSLADRDESRTNKVHDRTDAQRAPGTCDDRVCSKPSQARSCLEVQVEVSQPRYARLTRIYLNVRETIAVGQLLPVPPRSAAGRAHVSPPSTTDPQSTSRPRGPGRFYHATCDLEHRIRNSKSEFEFQIRTRIRIRYSIIFDIRTPKDPC